MRPITMIVDRSEEIFDVLGRKVRRRVWYDPLLHPIEVILRRVHQMKCWMQDQTAS